MNDDTLLPFDLPSVCRKKLTVDFNGGNQSSNGGLLLPRARVVPNRRPHSHAVRPMSRRAVWPLTLAHLGRSTQTRCTASDITPIQQVGGLPLVPSTDV
jgi:hypothetical protein